MQACSPKREHNILPFVVKGVLPFALVFNSTFKTSTDWTQAVQGEPPPLTMGQGTTWDVMQCSLKTASV